VQVQDVTSHARIPNVYIYTFLDSKTEHTNGWRKN